MIFENFFASRGRGSDAGFLMNFRLVNSRRTGSCLTQILTIFPSFYIHQKFFSQTMSVGFQGSKRGGRDPGLCHFLIFNISWIVPYIRAFMVGFRDILGRDRHKGGAPTTQNRLFLTYRTTHSAKILFLKMQ